MSGSLVLGRIWKRDTCPCSLVCFLLLGASYFPRLALLRVGKKVKKTVACPQDLCLRVCEKRVESAVGRLLWGWRWEGLC